LKDPSGTCVRRIAMLRPSVPGERAGSYQGR